MTNSSTRQLGAVGRTDTRAFRKAGDADVSPLVAIDVITAPIRKMYCESLYSFLARKVVDLGGAGFAGKASAYSMLTQFAHRFHRHTWT